MIGVLTAAMIVAFLVRHFLVLGELEAHEDALRCHVRGYGSMEECLILSDRRDLWDAADWEGP